MKQIFNKYLHGSSVIWVVFFALCIISAVSLFSASSALAFKSNSYTSPIVSHVTFLIVGIGLTVLTHYIPTIAIRVISYLALFVSIILLVLVFVPGIGMEINGAHRWVKIAGFTIQPSEIAKLSLILVAADLISRIRSQEDETKIFYILIGLTGLVCFLIMIANLSTAVLLGAVIFTMMFVGQISWKKLGLLFLGAATICTIGYFVGKNTEPKDLPGFLSRLPTWVNRIEEKKNDAAHTGDKIIVNDDNRQLMNCRIAIARGGLTGLMPGNSIQRDYLTYAYSDCIYAIIVEELGIILGGIGVIMLYMILLFNGGSIALRSTSKYAAVLATGLVFMITLQALISIGVSVGVGPVTGQPLPLISKGGTSILITCLYFGILQSVCREQDIKQETDLEPISEDTSENNIPSITIDEL